MSSGGSDSEGELNSSSKTPGYTKAMSNSPKSQGSNRSASESPRSGKSKSASPARSHSGSPNSQRSPSIDSNKSGSPARSASASPARSAGSNASRKSRSRSAASARSNRSGGSRSSNSDGSRSHSAQSNRSRSSGARSRSPAGSERSQNESNRSRSSSKSGSRSRSATPNQDKSSRGSSRSRSRSASGDRAKSPAESSEIRRRSSSEEEGVEAVKKNRAVIDSDSENEGKNDQPAAAAADLFGDADDISSEDEKDGGDKSGSDKDETRSREGDGDDERDERRRSDEENEQGDEDKEIEPIPETRIDVEIPKISCDLGRDIHFVKLPNFLSVETRPFDQDTYEDEIDEEETLDEEGRARLKLKVENTIRWREIIDEDGNVVKQSNARFVRWSDGSYSLHLGSEIFDVYKQPLQGDHNHLFIRQGTGLQGQAVFRTKLSFRPHSTESFTHRKMTLSLADRSQKTSGIKILSQVGVDPDQDRKTLLKKEEEKLRQVARVAKPRKRGEGPARAHGSSNVYREEEGSDDEGAISLNAIKNKYKSGAATATPSKGGAIYSSDEEGSDFEARRGRKLDKPKALKDSESSEESE